jgi:PadR family transcriptional regulator PadR
LEFGLHADTAVGLGWAILPFSVVLALTGVWADNVRRTADRSQLRPPPIPAAGGQGGGPGGGGGGGGSPANRYGYDLMLATSFPSGKLYPILTKLVRIGWLSREREDTDPAEVGRPSRFYYRLSADGVEAARYELAALSEQLAPPTRGLGFLRPERGRA